MSLRDTSIRFGMVLAVASLAACASGGGGEVEAAAPAGGDVMASADLVAMGSELYSARCTRCHGAEGVGSNRGPSLADADWAWIEGTDDPEAEATVAMILREGITEGRTAQNAMMPALGATMSDEEIDALVAYVLSLSM